MPLLGDGQTLVRDSADCAVRYRNAVDILNMSFNITGSHTLSIHGQNFLLYVLADIGLVLFQHLELKFPLSVSGNRSIYFAKVGTQPLAVLSVTAVIRVLVLVWNVFAVAQLVIQFCFQTILMNSVMVSLDKF